MIRRKYAIIGTGALGGFYGACLQRSGIDVHFLLNKDYEYVESHGLGVVSVDGDFHLHPVNAYCKADAMPPCDVAAIALKTTQNHLLPDLLPEVLKPGGLVLVLQNGLGVEEEIADILPSHPVMGGLCFLCANRIGPGRIHHLGYGRITLAEYANDGRAAGISNRMREIASDFERAGIPVELESDLQLARWKKLVWNVPFNGLSVVLDATTDRILASDAGRRLTIDLMRDVLEGARAQRCSIPDGFIDDMVRDTEKMQPYRTSMKIDYDEGRPMEIDSVYGSPLRVAEDHGIRLPAMRMMHDLLKYLDEHNTNASTRNSFENHGNIAGRL